jgi:hypothetical protein
MAAEDVRNACRIGTALFVARMRPTTGDAKV